MSEFVAVAVGGVLGAWARFLLGERVERTALDTLAVNVLGSFLLGVVLASTAGDAVVALAGVGFCGAFTTFSSFAVETVELSQDGEPGLAAANATITLGGAVVAVLAGYATVGAL